MIAKSVKKGYNIKKENLPWRKRKEKNPLDVAGTSTAVLGVTHGIIVPGKEAKLLGEKMSAFWKTESASWGLLGILAVVFLAIKRILTIDAWGAVCGYGLCLCSGWLFAYVLFVLVQKRKERYYQKLSDKKVILSISETMVVRQDCL